jgi:hypothetical protein
MTLLARHSCALPIIDHHLIQGNLEISGFITTLVTSLTQEEFDKQRQDGEESTLGEESLT